MGAPSPRGCQDITYRELIENAAHHYGNEAEAHARNRSQGKANRRYDSRKQAESNLRYHARLWLEAHGFSEDSTVGPELDAEFPENLKASRKRVGERLGPETARRHATEIRRLRKVYIQLRRAQSDTGRAFAEALKDRIAKAGIPVDQLAKRANVASPTLHGWLKGRLPGGASRAKIAPLERELGCNSGDLLGLLPDCVPKYRPFRHRDLPASVSGLPRRLRTQVIPHLPENFEEEPPDEQERIVNWVLENLVHQPTPYAKSVRSRQIDRYAFSRSDKSERPVPGRLRGELDDLFEFRTSPWVPETMERDDRQHQNPRSAAKVDELFRRVFGAACLDGEDGVGLKPEDATLAYLTRPGFVRWASEWRAQRRAGKGQPPRWIEPDMGDVSDIRVLLRPKGWLRQRPDLAKRLVEVPGLVGKADIRRAQEDWALVCDEGLEALHAFAKGIMRAINSSENRYDSHSRRPFAPIHVVLDAEKPLREYMKISPYARARFADPDVLPRQAAYHRRDYLVWRVPVETGLRLRNNVELRPGPPKEGERAYNLWYDPDAKEPVSKRAGAWRIVIDSIYIKNRRSSVFRHAQELRIVLPDYEGLYAILFWYMDQGRSIILKGTEDPGRVFVSENGPMTEREYARTYRKFVVQYGILNPWTGNGVIEGLMPHGPHAARDIRATHAIKITGGTVSVAAASIHDTEEVVRQHYARWVPSDAATYVETLFLQSLGLAPEPPKAP